MAYFLFAAVVAATYIYSPFPYWPTYFRLWRSVLFSSSLQLPFSTRIRQAALLVRYAALTPFWSILWYLDELLFPNYRKQEINPIFIIGQPRSGTTLLHRTLANDQATFFAVRHIEWRFPFITVQKLIAGLNLTSYFNNLSYWPSNAVGKAAAQMHPNHLSDWEEDGIFYEERFLHHFFVFLRFPYPELLSQLDGFLNLPQRVQKKMLQKHHQVIQKVKYLRGNSNLQFLSKEVTSHNKIPSLLEQYSSARYIVITRPSREFMNSLMLLVRASTESKTGIDPKLIPGWEDLILKRMVADSRLLVQLCTKKIQESQQIRINYQVLNEKPLETVSYLYAKLKLQIPPELRNYLLQLHEQQKNRSHDYKYDAVRWPGFEDFDVFVEQSVNASGIKPN